MTCTSCAAEVREGAKFCSECGTLQSTACPSCGNPAGPSDKFCAECGHRMATAQPAAAAEADAPGPASTPVPPARIEERRFITVVFNDLVGFTPLTQAHDSEDVRNMLTAYFDRARQIVTRFGGTIDKFIGDAVMAVWGADVAHEDDAERAVRAAMELVEAVEDLGRELDLPDLRARAGVLSGEAATGGDGNDVTGLIVGEIVNTASRLQSAAEPGTVLVGRSTRDLAQRSIEFEAAGEREMKGLSAPVETFRAVRVVAGRRGSRRVDGLEPPFVGRADELRLLKDALHACRRDNRSRLVSIVGQGGIGKSRLVEEFWKYVDGLPETTYWHQGRSPAYGDGVAFWSLGEMVRQRCGIVESEDPHRARTRLRTTLVEFVEDPEDRAWAEPRLEGLLGLSEMPAGDRMELFAAWRILFTEMARRDTVVMVFEDLHWADDGVADFIDELVTLAVDQPILVLTLARPDLLERRPGWGSGRTSTMSAHLAPLAETTMRELVEGVVLDPPRPLLNAIVERAGGIPLYAVELLRMLHTQDSLQPADGGRFHFIGDPGGIAIPDSLHGLVGARLDQLDPEERSLVQDAAILGQSFTLDGLRTLRGGTVEELAEALDPLVRREVLSVNRDPRSPERGQYRFVQAIIREVAHQRIPRSERFARHLRIAHHFRSLDEPELVGIVANHLLDALEVATPDRQDEIRDETIVALLAAADRADALQSPGQVLRLCERGIELTDDPREQGELLTRAARAAHAAVDDRADAFAARSLEAFRSAGDRLGAVRAATAWAWMLNGESRSNEAWPKLREALGDDPGESPEEARAMAQLARSYMLDLRDDDGFPWIERALPVAERLELVPVIVDALITKGTALGKAGRIREGMALLEASLGLAREQQLLHAKHRALQNIGYLEASDRPLEDDETMLERIEDARRVGDRRQVEELELARAFGSLWRLDLASGREIIERIDPEALSEVARFSFEDDVAMLETLTGDGTAFLRVHQQRGERGRGDAQSLASEAGNETVARYFAGEFEIAFESALRIPPTSPPRLDILHALLPALRLKDRDRLVEVAELAAANPFRGRSATLMRLAAEAGVAVLESHRSRAVDLFSEAIALAEQVWPEFHGALLKAEAAALLGKNEEPGLSWGREAFEAYRDAGYTTMLVLVGDGLITDEDLANRTAGAAAG